MKMKLGMKVDLDPGHIVLDGKYGRRRKRIYIKIIFCKDDAYSGAQELCCLKSVVKSVLLCCSARGIW